MTFKQKFLPSFLQRPLTTLAIKFFDIFEKPLVAGLITFFALALIAKWFGFWGLTKPTNYFSLLADAFIHGQLNLRLIPTITHDLSLFQGKLYLYWPPLPAILSIPLIILFGVNFSDIVLTIVISSMNVAIICQLLRKCNSRGLINLTTTQRGLLVFAFGFGTAQVPQALLGEVWSTSLLIGVLCVAITYLSAVSLKEWMAFLMTGISIAAALATRNTLILAGIWPAYYLLKQHWSISKKKLITYSLLGILPILLTIIGLGLYNYARFGSIYEIGYQYHNMDPFFRTDYERYGAFNLHYIPRNLYYQWIAYPFFSKNATEIYMGGSLVLLSPIFLAALWAIRDRNLRDHVVVLAVTIIFLYLPIVLLMGTGYIQLGPRYLLDFMVPLLILTSIGGKYWHTRHLGIVVAISFLHYLGLILW